MKEKRLGMGLDALLGGGPKEAVTPDSNPDLALDQLRPNPYQPRVNFDDEETVSLAESIRRSGVLQPIVVRRQNGVHEIVAGERRYRAAQLAGLERIPVVVREVSDDEMLTLALIENIHRKDLNPIEKARAFRQLIQQQGWTQEQAAEALSLARPTIANFIRLLDLPPEIQEAVSRGTIAMGHARALVGLTNRAQLARFLQRVVNEDLSVRALEHLVATEARTARKAPRSKKEAHIADLEQRLTDHLGTKVQVRPRGSAGEVVIQYYSTDQFNGLIQQLGLK